MAIINFFIQSIDWLFPRSCCLCKQLLSTKQFICLDCQRKLPWNAHPCPRCALPLPAQQPCGACLANPPQFTQCIAPFLYEPPISTLIIQLKFQHQLYYARVLGDMLAHRITQHSSLLPQAIIPVPLHKHRLRHRGFNQAVEIAKALSQKLDIPVLSEYCYRSKNTPPQSQLSARARQHNLAAAFAVRKKISLEHVAIVDDVMTTGQTVRSLSQILHKQGIKKIDVWCCARSPL